MTKIIWRGAIGHAIAACILAGTGSANAQEAAAKAGALHPTFTIGGSVRGRTEGIDGQFRPKLDSRTAFVSFRTLVNAQVEMDGFLVGGELLDARGYGEGHNSSVKSTDVNTIEPLQAYARYTAHGVFGAKDSLSATAGRFTMTFGAQRLVARADFGNSFPSYLGARIDYQTKARDQLTLFWTHPMTALPDTMDAIFDNKVQLDRVSANVAFFGADGNVLRLAKRLSVGGYVYRLVEKDRPGVLTRDRRLVTVGLRSSLAAAKGRIDFEVEAAIQHGRARATTAIGDRTDLTVRAGFVHAEMGYTLPLGWSPRVSAMFDYASGDGPNAAYGRFDSLFGARRADYGPVSLFGPVGLANLVSPGARIEAKPSKRFDVMLSARDLWLAARTDTFAFTPVRDRTGSVGRHAGTEFELRLRRTLIAKKLRLEMGAAYLAKGKFLNQAPNAAHHGDARYGYADIVFNF